MAKNIDDPRYVEYYKQVDSNFLIRVFQFFKYKFILKIFKYARKDALILDVGCGSGKFLANLKSYGYTNLSGLDLDEAAFQNNDTKGIAFIKRSIVSDECDMRAEVVFLQSVLHHLPGDKLPQIADNINKILEGGGYCLFTNQIFRPAAESCFITGFCACFLNCIRSRKMNWPNISEFASFSRHLSPGWKKMGLESSAALTGLFTKRIFSSRISCYARSAS